MKTYLLKVNPVLLIILSFVIPLLGWTNVNSKNGNLYLGNRDLAIKGGLDLSIDRVYNSKSSYDGSFGFGWGSSLDTNVKSIPDGTALVFENGGGAINQFQSAVPVSAQDTGKVIDALVGAHSKESTSRDQIKNYRERLVSDLSFRASEWERFTRSGILKANLLPDGAQLRSLKFTYQVLTKTKDGYIRSQDNGRTELFDLNGRLIRIADKNNNYISIERNKSGAIDLIKDNLGHRLKLTSNELGKITSIQSEDGKKALYSYSGNLLVKSVDTSNNVFEYKYSNDGRYNLAQVKQKNKVVMDIGYYPAQQGEGVKFVRAEDGTLTEYEYSPNSVTGLEYWTKVTVKEKKGKVISKAKYEYVDREKKDGDRYTYRTIVSLDGSRTETTFNECCALPLSINKNGSITSFEYDAKGHVVKKATPSEITELQYHETLGKVTRIQTKSLANSQGGSGSSTTQWIQYEYDARGNLSSAKNSNNEGVRLVYDTYGRIKAMIDHKKHQLEFVYNELGRPVTITDPSVGKIDVTYGTSGEISNVKATEGRNVASQVMGAFQNLIKMIQPAQGILLPSP